MVELLLQILQEIAGCAHDAWSTVSRTGDPSILESDSK